MSAPSSDLDPDLVGSVRFWQFKLPNDTGVAAVLRLDVSSPTGQLSHRYVDTPSHAEALIDMLCLGARLAGKVVTVERKTRYVQLVPTYSAFHDPGSRVVVVDPPVLEIKPD